jgi:excinuclease ABC subunit A
MNQDTLEIKGARVHNLKNISCAIQHGTLAVITGVSGSGKSSLAFDTIYAEGQRRYIESLSAYARQFLERIEKPDVDFIDGIAPAIAIRQKNSVRTPRSTVGTVTEIYDYLRLLFSRAGRTICWQCHREVKRDVIDEIVPLLLSLPEGTRLYLQFPLKEYRKYRELTAPAQKTKKRRQGPMPEQEIFKAVLFELRKHGFNRLCQAGRIVEFSTPESLLDLDFNDEVSVLVDRLVIRPDIRQRLADSIEICYHEGGGHAIAEFAGLPSADGQSAITSEQVPDELPLWRQRLEDLRVGARLSFNEKFQCKTCQITFANPEPRLFSFNNPYGACPVCQGFGNTIEFDLNLVIPDAGKSLQEGAIEPWTKPRYRSLVAEFKRWAKARGIPLQIPYNELTPEQKKLIYDGDEEFVGIKGFFDYLEKKKYKLYIRVFLSRYRGYTLCPGCQGTRLRKEARAIQVGGREITEISRMTIESAGMFFQGLQLTPAESAVAQRILEEIHARLDFLHNVGLDYLTLDRLASTLSGGEAQRIQLATSLGSSLVGALYVLDEPSIGLHPRDNERLICILKQLRDMGNTVIVVEHEPEMMKAADQILDMGPGAGEQGGQVVFSGSYPALLASPHSLTGRYMKGELRILVPAQRRQPGLHWLRIYGAREHNLKQIDVQIPLGLITCITGVSGSGKSTLVHDVIYPALQSTQHGGPPKENFDRIDGSQFVSDVILVDQSPIGRTPRSNPVTYLKAFDAIRELFASTREAQTHSFEAGHFSFNIPGGRCETCQGDGTVTVEMQFLADVELVCEECHGMRFKSEILDIHYKGKNIYEVLQMSVREAMAFFSGVSKITNKLKVLQEVGLGYLRLGQSATTLSGGEAQRVKLAYYLARQPNLKTLYIFDEPTTGLHFDDINKLLMAFRRLQAEGGTLLIIEHNLDIIKTADWLIDLGPEGGDAGGYVVTCGIPEQVTAVAGSYTGRYLKEILAASRNGNGHGNGSHP